MLTIVAFNVRTTDISTVVTSLSVFLNVSNNTKWVIKKTLFRKNCWNVLKWVTGHCNRVAVSRNRYSVEKTVDTHKILINAITFYVCLQEI